MEWTTRTGSTATPCAAQGLPFAISQRNGLGRHVRYWLGHSNTGTTAALYRQSRV